MDKCTIAVAGAGGQLGQAFYQAAMEAGIGMEFHFFTKDQMNLLDPESVRAMLVKFGVGTLINCAAFTAVEQSEREPEQAAQLNAYAASMLAEVCRLASVRLVHFSTDYVFDGNKRAPYVETDTPCPLNQYGLTKLQGEQAIAASGCRYWIFRTAWLFSPYGENFIMKMLRLGRERGTLSVVSDQIGCPTSALDLARAVIRTVGAPGHSGSSGLFHLINSGSASWHDLAKEAIRLAGLPCEVIAVRSDAFPSAVNRPLYSVLDCAHFSKAFGFGMRPWQEALAETVQMIKHSRN